MKAKYNLKTTMVHQKAKEKKITTVKKEFSAWILIAPLIFLVFFLIWYPQVMSIYLSFFNLKGYTPQSFVGLKNYINVLSDTLFPKILLNTIKYVLWSLVLGYFLPVIVAIMINEMVHFKTGFKFCIYFPAILPGIAVSLMWYLIYFPDGGGLLNMLLQMIGLPPQEWLQNTKWAIPLLVISMTWKGMPASMLIYLASLQGINQELYEAAIIDGAGVLKRIRTITIPQISGVMLLLLIKQIISVFQVLEQPMAMTSGGPNNATITLSYLAYKEGFEYFRVGPAMAIGNILFVILIVFTSFYFYISRKVDERL